MKRYVAAMAVAAATEKPLVLQIHSTEIDRAGINANPRILDIERDGMLAAHKIIAVSQRTKSQLTDRYHATTQRTIRRDTDQHRDQSRDSGLEL